MSRISDALKIKFPWLGTDGEWDLVGSEIINDLEEMFRSECNKPDSFYIDNLVIDWRLFREQKQILSDSSFKIDSLRESAEGILCLMDAIQDFAVDSGQFTKEEVDGSETGTEQPSTQFQDKTFWQVGCTKCDSKPGEWKIYHDGKDGFISKCARCDHISKLPPEKVATAPSADINAACAVCGNVSSYDKESLAASTYDINGIPTILCCPCEDDLLVTLAKNRNITILIDDDGELENVFLKGDKI